MAKARPVIRALAVTVSNRAAAGVYADRSGPVLVGLLRRAGCTVDGPLVVPDGDPVEEALRDAVAAGYDVVVTTGGTGLTPADLTPEMTRRVLDREIPGSPKRSGRRARGGRAGRDAVPRRGGAGRGMLIVNLPGSTGGVRDGMAVLAACCGTRSTRRTAATTPGRAAEHRSCSGPVPWHASGQPRRFMGAIPGSTLRRTQRGE